MAHHASGEADYPWLSEFLCEYVDGTMDPAARAMFEECLCGNDDLAAHVERLRAARQLLCAYGCKGMHAPCDLHYALHQRIAREAQGSCAAPLLAGRLGVASLVFATLLVVMVGAITLPDGGSGEATRQPAIGASVAATPVFYLDRASVLPDTLPRSTAMLRIRAASANQDVIP